MHDILNMGYRPGPTRCGMVAGPGVEMDSVGVDDAAALPTGTVRSASGAGAAVAPHGVRGSGPANAARRSTYGTTGIGCVAAAGVLAWCFGSARAALLIGLGKV